MKKNKGGNMNPKEEYDSDIINSSGGASIGAFLADDKFIELSLLDRLNGRKILELTEENNEEK
jgi:hypothetical protein